jgi:hypothetical protein
MNKLIIAALMLFAFSFAVPAFAKDCPSGQRWDSGASSCVSANLGVNSTTGNGITGGGTGTTSSGMRTTSASAGSGSSTSGY